MIKKISKDSKDILLILFGSICIIPLLILIWVATFYFSVSNQYKEFIKELEMLDVASAIFICIIIIPLLIYNNILATWNQFYILIKILFYPLSKKLIPDSEGKAAHEPRMEVGKILKKESKIIMWVFSLVYIFALLLTPLNKYYSGWVKGLVVLAWSILTIKFYK